MAYYIAVGSSNGENVDLKFGETDRFYIYRVEEKTIALQEVRKVENTSSSEAETLPQECGDPVPCGDAGKTSCSSSGCSGNGHGCGGGEAVIGKVALIEDCRCVVCKKVGFQAQKQFERKAISVFDVDISVKDALDKITSYYFKIDNRQSLRSPVEKEEEE